MQGLVGDGLRGSDHLAEVHHHGDERRRVGVDLLREVGERRTARQPDNLALATRQHHAAYRRGLHGLVLLAPLPLRLTATTGRSTGTAERALCATTATGTTRTTAEAGTATAATETATTGTTRSAATAATGATGEATAATATGTTGETAAATGTTAATATGGPAGTTGTTATAGATAWTRTRGGTLRHHARVRTVTGGGAAGTRGATGTGHTTGAGATALATGTGLRTGTALTGALRTRTTGSAGCRRGAGRHPDGAPAGAPFRWSHPR